MGIIQMSYPEVNEIDIQEIVTVLKSGRLATGPKTKEFEEMVCQYVNTKHGIAVSSGTAGLHILIRALDIKEGDEVIVPSFTFASSVNVILYERATPVFAEINDETYTVDPGDIEKKITNKTKAIMAVDIFGHPAEWDEILRIAEKYGLRVIDDSCEALGAEYKGKKIGQFGDCACFAFYPNKQITTGEGGMIVTNDDRIATVARSLRNQGRGEMGSWLEHEILGYNYRMDEMSAALGVSQLRRIDEILKKREHVAFMYTEKLKKLDFLRVPYVKPYAKMSWFVYVITLEKGLDRKRIMEKMADMGIPTRGYFSPMHLQPYIKKIFGFKGGELPVTEDIARRTIALPFHNNLTEEEIDLVIDALKKAVLG